MRPVDVDKEIEGTVFQILYGFMKKNEHPIFKRVICCDFKFSFLFGMLQADCA